MPVSAVRRTAAVGLSAAAAAAASVVMPAPPAAADHNGCATEYACFWRKDGNWGGQFKNTNTVMPAIIAWKGYNHGKSGLRACAFEHNDWKGLRFSIAQKQWKQRQPSQLDVALTSSKWVDGTCS